MLEIEQNAPALDSAGHTLINFFLQEQQQLTAVERFSKIHDDDAPPQHQKFYRDLIPLSAPEKGQQYGFEVDLDSCTGCKACVTACHSMNGLDDDEVWRTVGAIQGGNEDMPIFQMVTSACHHCAHPACMIGCPTNAYAKDEFTGIVVHLDDQCIGCQYCVLKCPYDVPKYNPKRGIVRKCDMCSSRLSAKEAPACVQACPNKAIRITVVDKLEIAERAEKNDFLPGAPEPAYTQPATRYHRKNPLPYNTAAADLNRAAPEPAHLPLVFMLVLTQLSIGAFTLDWLIGKFAPSLALDASRPAFILAMWFAGCAGLNAAILHLGRPLYAFRAVLNLKGSWMSREIVGLSANLGASSGFAASVWLPRFGIHFMDGLAPALQLATVITGVLGAFCSMMIYIDTHREFWKAPHTLPRFALTAVLLGLGAWVLFGAIQAHRSGAPLPQSVKDLSKIMAGVTLCKLIFEATIFRRLRKYAAYHPLRKSALLMVRELLFTTNARFVCGFAGGMALPLIFFSQPVEPDAALVLCAASIALLLTGEILERYLYFRAVVALKMPGGSSR